LHDSAPTTVTAAPTSRQAVVRGWLAAALFTATVVVYGATPFAGTGAPFVYLAHALRRPAAGFHPPDIRQASVPRGAAPAPALAPRHQRPMLDTGYEELALGDSLATTGRFANPFRWPTGPSAHLGPVFPLWVAAIIRVFGVGRLGYSVLLWSAILAVAVQLALYPRLALALGLEPLAGALAAVAWLLTRYPLYEPFVGHSAGLAVVVLLVPLLRCLDDDMGRATLLATGLGCGVAILLQPVVALPIGLWLIVVSVRGHWRRALLLLALQALVVLPWCARNARVLGHWSFVRDNAGLELEVANNDCAEASFVRTRASGCFAMHHPNENRAEAARVRRAGEPAYDAVKQATAKAWIEAHPRRFVTLTLQRLFDFLFPEDPDNGAGGLPWAVPLASLLCLPGLVPLWRSDRRGAAMLTLWLVCFTVAHAFVLSTARYRVPILWAFLLPAGQLLVVAARRPANALRARWVTRPRGERARGDAPAPTVAGAGRVR
jgi:hypothetical protein